MTIRAVKKGSAGHFLLNDRGKVVFSAKGYDGLRLAQQSLLS